MGIAIRKEDEKLLEDINKVLKALKNEKYVEISEKYFGEDITK